MYVKIEDTSLFLGSNGLAKLSGMQNTGCPDFYGNPAFPPGLVEASWSVFIDTNHWCRSINFDFESEGKEEGRRLIFLWGMDVYGDWFIKLGKGTNRQTIIMFKEVTKTPVATKKHFAATLP